MNIYEQVIRENYSDLSKSLSTFRRFENKGLLKRCDQLEVLRVVRKYANSRDLSEALSGLMENEPSREPSKAVDETKEDRDYIIED